MDVSTAAAMEGEPVFSFQRAIEFDKGRSSCISVLSESDIAIVVTDFNFSRSLHYTIGTVYKSETKVSWNGSTYYTTGKCPSIDLLYFDGETYAIEIHCNFSLKCHYNVWKVDKREGKIIGKCDGTLLGAGSYPKVCATNDGFVVVIYEASYGSTALYALGKLNASKQSITWKYMMERFPHCGINFSVASKNKKIVVAFRNNYSKQIDCVLGTLNTASLEISWESVRVGPGQGLYPSVSVNCHDNVVMGYQSLFGRSLSFVYGEITDTSIFWHFDAKEENGTSGEFPSVAFSDSGQVFDLHKTHFGTKLYLRVGSVEKQRITKDIALNPPNGEN